MVLVYSCCFWFSLRLGGIIIGVLSLIQAIIVLVLCSIAYGYTDDIKETLTHWINDMELVYTEPVFETILADPNKYLTVTITLMTIYIVLCGLYIYGAYYCMVTLMLGFVVAELARLLALAALLTTWLVVAKENSMDIGQLIGASVLSGFLLLGMWYLWVCSCSLPALVQLTEREEQAESLARLRRLLQQEAGQREMYGADVTHYLR
ncbi:unnamed protein product [Plutella xylostella]|uniref:(diamondback moth) hypothetical protein n=1 Tax=Plutella xylostella TaxID=51655 RepID=A0A8S4EHX9_PLUXY|nr:unnamed protein product [Plutella xylostella]